MKHLHYDGIQGYRSRFDDIHLVYEFLEEVPPELGLRPAMPPFILPYYNGVVPEDEGDLDGDGYAACDGDCDDGHALS